MPYKDSEKQKEVMREIMRKRRAEEKQQKAALEKEKTNILLKSFKESVKKDVE